MEPKQANPDHTASRELLAGYALGILTPEEQAMLAEHLARYPDLRAELAVLTQAVNAIPLALDEREPSPALRDRLEAAVLADLAASPAPAGTRPPVMAAPGATRPPGAPLPPPTPLRRSRTNVWAIAAAVLLLITSAAVFWGLQQSRQAGDPERTIALAVTDAAPDASGQLAYLPEARVMVVTVDDLPPLPPGQVYEFWLIGHDGVPLPAGVFAGTSVRHALAGSPDDFQAVAITVEPGPLGTTAPTTDPLAVASLAAE